MMLRLLFTIFLLHSSPAFAIKHIKPQDLVFPLSNVQPYPDGFLFGAASGAYQIEGGWNVDVKGHSIWDTFVHKVPSPIADGSTDDVACNSYSLYKEDVKNLVKIGAKVYRFSISWPRVLPDGTRAYVSKLGVQYYSNLIDELLKHGIIPMITTYHWDLPQALEDNGGWVSDTIVDTYGDYVDLLFETFGDRVKWWITLNEPTVFCTLGYGTGQYAPGVIGYGVKEYQCFYNSLLAHARAYRIYHEKYKSQGGRVSLILNCNACYPKQKNQDDIDACGRYYDFYLGIFAHPIFTTTGNYPEIVIQTVDTNSRNLGFENSRLVPLNQTQIDYIKGTADFFAMNIYSSTIVAAGSTVNSAPSFFNDIGVETSMSRFWPRTSSRYIRITPKAMRDMLVLIKNRYGNPEIFVTENGVDDSPLFDKQRILFFKSYWGSMQKAILQDGIRVIGYLAWSLMDDFEWTNGYTIPFGLYHTNFRDPKRKRTPRASASFYKQYVKSNTGNSIRNE